MKMLLLSIVTMLSVSALAENRYIDSADLHGCGGRVVLGEAPNGDLSLKFENRPYSAFNPSYCNGLQFVDVSSGRVIKEYQVKGTSYTLSKSMMSSLSSDCRVAAYFNNGYNVTQRITVSLNWCRPVSQPSHTRNPYSFQLSGSDNCKLMINGQYSNRNVSDDFCGPLTSRRDVVTYEWSKNDNCKIMINGNYTNQNTADKYCRAQF